MLEDLFSVVKVRFNGDKADDDKKKTDIPKGLLFKCPRCRNVTFMEEFQANGKVCPHCNYHSRLTARERLDITIDKGSFEEFDKDMISKNPIDFPDYEAKQQALREKTGLKDAVLTGKATKWSDVVPGSKRGDIEVIFDNTRSATTNFVVDSVLHGEKMGAKIMAAKTSKQVIDFVDQNPGSIGVIGSNWLNDRRDSTNTTFKKNIHVMRVSIKDKATPSNSWQPYQAYLLDGRYPFVRTIYAIVVDPHKALPWSFANYITNPKGQLILFKTGLLPYRGDITIRTVNVKR